MIKMYKKGNQKRVGKFNVDMINVTAERVEALLKKGWCKSADDAYAPVAMPEPTPVSVPEVEREVPDIPKPKKSDKK